MLNDITRSTDILVFQLGDLLCFGILVAMGILFRHRPDAHKRLMLLATVGALMPAALSHIIGHSPFLRGFHPAIILIPYTVFLFAGAVEESIGKSIESSPVTLEPSARLETGKALGPETTWELGNGKIGA